MDFFIFYAHFIFEFWNFFEHVESINIYSC